MKKITSCARAPRLVLLRVHVVVLPQQPAVALVDADRARQRLRLAVIVGERGVEQRGVLGRVGVRLRSSWPAGRRCIRRRRTPRATASSDRSRRTGTTISDSEAAIQDRPHAIAVLVADRVQDQALARVQRVAEAPLLPADLLAVDREARSVRLRDRRAVSARCARPWTSRRAPGSAAASARRRYRPLRPPGRCSCSPARPRLRSAGRRSWSGRPTR